MTTPPRGTPAALSAALIAAERRSHSSRDHSARSPSAEIETSAGRSPGSSRRTSVTKFTAP